MEASRDELHRLVDSKPIPPIEVEEREERFDGMEAIEKAKADAEINRDARAKVADIRRDIAETQRKIQEQKENVRICLRVRRTSTNDAVRRQAERDLLAEEATLERLNSQLRQEMEEIKTLSKD
jgi:hypothetical protein